MRHKNGSFGGSRHGMAIGLLCGLLIVSGAIVMGTSAGAGEAPQKRVPGTVEIHGSPDGIDQYVIVEAFPNLRFNRPVWIGHPPDGSNYMWVMERDGLIKVFENKREVKKTQVALDLRKKVLTSHVEEGLQGMAFHPNFKKNKAVYICYSAGEPRRTVVSRYETSGTRRRVRPDTERVLLRQRQPYGNHNGGCLAFGPDERLYISYGDGGSFGDPENQAQNLESWLGSILRIDVSNKKSFSSPPDNPLVGVQHTRPEIYAYGLQNVRRFSFDRLTGDLWAGDVGNAKFQEINVIKAGGNYGWNLREGTAEFKKGRSLSDLQDPVLALGPDEATRITGGFVYRGKRMPGLIGAYVYGDLGTGNIWALRWDGKEVKENLLIGRGRGVTSFGEDKDGEIYITSFDGKVSTLAPWTGHKPKGRFPRRLSDTGLFLDTHALTPHPALVPYEVNVPLWSDGANKRRYVMLPGMEKIKVHKDGHFEFPVGTIFLKHFFLGEDARGPLPGTRLETRLFVKDAREWRAYTYVWNRKQTDATLLDGRMDQARLGAHGSKEKVNWTFPSRSDCMSCHTDPDARILGFRTEQLDRDVDYGGTTESQLDVLKRLDFFEGKAAKTPKAWPAWNDPEADETQAVRAYMEVNCAMCHRPDGPGNALIDLRYETPLKKSNLVNRRPGQWNLGVYGGRLVVPGKPAQSLLYVRLKMTDEKGMPPIGYNVIDERAVERIGNWIKGMK